MKKILIAIIRLVIIVGLVNIGFSKERCISSTESFTIQSLTNQAEIIVLGTVKDIKSKWNEERTLIYSYITISIDKYYKGSGPWEVIIKQKGGKIGEKETVATGAPQFELGEDIFLFLVSEENGHFEVLHSTYGKFSLIPKKPQEKSSKWRMIAKRWLLEENKSEEFYLDVLLREIQNFLKTDLDEIRMMREQGIYLTPINAVSDPKKKSSFLTYYQI